MFGKYSLDKKVIGNVDWSQKHGGSYEIMLPSGVMINAVSQSALKRMVAENI